MLVAFWRLVGWLEVGWLAGWLEAGWMAAGWVVVDDDFNGEFRLEMFRENERLLEVKLRKSFFLNL